MSHVALLGFLIPLLILIAIKLGQQWQEEDPSTKQHYKDKAEEIKKKHNEQHPTYQYQPRRASEKKRRMTKAKAAMSNTSDSPSKSPPDIAHVNAPTARAPRPTGRELGMYIPQSSLAATFAGTNGNGPLNTNPTSPGFRLLASGSRLTYDHQAANGAAILNMNFSEDAADEAVYDDAFMDWPQWTADADQVRQQTMEDFHNYEANFAPQYNSDLAGYGAPLRSWHQHTADAYLRHGRLHTEFQDRPRSLWNIATTSVPNASEPQTMAPPPTQDYQDPSMYTTADLTALTAQGSAVQSSHMPATETFHRQEPQALDTDLPSQYMNGENLQQYDGFMPADDGFFSSLDNFNSNIDDEGFMLRLNSEP